MKLDTGHYHEVMDRAATIETLIDAILAEHPAVKGEPELTAGLAKLQEAAADFYQLAGRIDFRHMTTGRNPGRS